MSSPISTILANLRRTVNVLRSAVYAIDVRDDIADAIDDSADAIEQIYSDVDSASLREDAFAAALQEAIDDNLLPIPATVIDDNSLPGTKIQDGTIPLRKLSEAVQITVDSALSGTSTNPVQNKVIKETIDELNGSLENLEGNGLSDESIGLLEYILNNICYTNGEMKEYVDTFILGLYGGFTGGPYTPKNVIRGAYIDADGKIVSATNASGYFEDFIKVSKKILGELCGGYSGYTGTTRNYRITEYDADKQFIKQTQVTTETFDIELDSSTVYIRLGFYLNGVNVPTPVFSIAVPGTTGAKPLAIEIGDISNTTGEESTDLRRVRSDEIEVESNIISVYGCFWAQTIRKFDSHALFAIRCYDEEKIYIGTSATLTCDVTNLELPSGTKYIRFIWQKSSRNFPPISPANYPMYVNGIKYRVLEV